MYSFDSVVRFSECDEFGQLTIPALINYLQDCSTFHTESLGHGITYTRSRGFAWFIMAWQIRIARLPRFLDHIRVSTWVHSMKPTSSCRNFIIATLEGETLVEADSLWVAYDVEHGRPMRIPDGERVLVSGEERLAMPPLKRKLGLSGTGDEYAALSVSEELLDANHHVNNGQYVAVADRVVRQKDESFVPREILVQYKKAAVLGDSMVPVLYIDPSTYTVELGDGMGDDFAIVRFVCS